MRSSPIFEMPTGKQFLKSVRQWMKTHNVGPRKFAEITGTSRGTLSKLTVNPDSISMATILKYQKAMCSYRGADASRPSSNPARSASKRAAR